EQRDRAHRRAGGSSQLKWQADEGKFVTLVACQLLKEEIFYDIDTIAYEQNRMTGQRHLEIGIDSTNLIPGSIVSSHCLDSFAGKPGRCTGTHSSRLQIHGRVLP